MSGYYCVIWLLTLLHAFSYSGKKKELSLYFDGSIEKIIPNIVPLMQHASNMSNQYLPCEDDYSL